MSSLIAAKVLHVLGVVLWIGGVAMVTTVLLPATRCLKTPEEQVAFFEQVERRFAWQARFTTLLTGASGFYLLSVMDAWSRYTTPGYWWIHAMTAVWVLFTLILFVLEPMILHRLFLKKAKESPRATFAFIQIMHWVLLTVSLVTIAGAVAGSHGWSFV